MIGAAPWLEVAAAELGIAEAPGKPTHPRIAEYLATVGQDPDDEIAWCSAFVQWCFQQVGIAGSGKASARSWMSWGKSVAVPLPGAVTVLWREQRDGWKGHVGLYLRGDNSGVWLLGGNQGNQVTFARFPRERVLGYRSP